MTTPGISRQLGVSPETLDPVVAFPLPERHRCRALDVCLGAGTALGAKARAGSARNTRRPFMSGQQSSAGKWAKTPASQTGAACVPSDQLSTAAPGLMTAHRSCAVGTVAANRATAALNALPRSA